jgi:hypothetical protein
MSVGAFRPSLIDGDSVCFGNTLNFQDEILVSFVEIGTTYEIQKPRHCAQAQIFGLAVIPALGHIEP